VVFLIFLWFLLVRPVMAADPVVKITNFSSNSSPEWVEIHNQTSSAIDIGNWKIRNGNSSLTDDLTLTGCLSADGYQTFYHDSGWLNDGGDTISLYDAQNNLIDQLVYTKGQSLTNPKTTNSCQPTLTPVPTATVVLTLTPTNPPLPTITPSPTDIPTNTPTPTNTPIPTLVPTDTPLPSSTPMPTDTPLPILTPVLEATPTDSTELSASNSNSSLLGDILGATDPQSSSPSSPKMANLLPLIFIIAGGILLATPLIISKIKINWPLKKQN
jgi:hypothetical protein